MDISEAFAKALRSARRKKGLTQEDFSVVSSRTYLSTLERGMKSPTLEKIEALASRLEVHPLTLMVLAYQQDQKEGSLRNFLDQIEDEVKELQR